MNRHHLEVITPNGILSRVVEADHMDPNSYGFYQFSNRVESVEAAKNGIILYDLIACYPIVNTIVEKIEYDINQ